MWERSAGILLHITSLPSKHEIGDIGQTAQQFAGALHAAGIKYWQLLPLTPTSLFIGNSPYSSPSAFAGNELLISPELLISDGFINQSDLEEAGRHAQRSREYDPEHVDYQYVSQQKEFLLRTAFERYRSMLAFDRNFQTFCTEHKSWLDDYALFAALKEVHAGQSWTEWEDGLKWRDTSTLFAWHNKHVMLVEKYKFIQFLFFSQWEVLRKTCRNAGVKLIGDMPIYVTHDSADVWSNPDLFLINSDGHSEKVTGVPPDYFSATGQRWGNPVYNWEKMQQTGFSWWIHRLEHTLKLVDIVRMDHFRGFCGYWSIPAQEKTAVNGNWEKAPGQELFTALQEHFGNLPVIAEDLGVITDDVRELMKHFNLPGMKVLHFAFNGDMSENSDVPYNHHKNCVVYTGTHDNTTSVDWFNTAPPETVKNFKDYCALDNPDSLTAANVMIRLALGSPGHLAIIPIQDLLYLGAEARMNTPSTIAGNWTWKLKHDEESNLKQLGRLKHFAELCRIYGR